MKKVETSLKDCWLFEPDLFEDERGYFFEGFNSQEFKRLTDLDFEVKQINQSRSSKGVLRGLHYQTRERPQAKLVSCIEGEVLDVAVDLRKGSPTYGSHFTARLSNENKKQLYIPRGMAHGFLVLSDQAKLMYLTDGHYSKPHDTGIIYNDPQLNIAWGVKEEDLILSEKDQNLPLFENAILDF